MFRLLLAYILIPVIQKQLDLFAQTICNSHRIRAEETFLPDGVPDHIYNFPERYGLEDCSPCLGGTPAPSLAYKIQGKCLLNSIVIQCYC